MEASKHRPQPLAGLTVLDLTIALAGPYATMLLAGLGARVIKLENPLSPDPGRSNSPYVGKGGAKLVRENEDDISVSVLNRLRNKMGITLNLKHPNAREIFAHLIKTSDVLVENFSQGTLERLGYGYKFANEINPRLVYCSLTGFGANDTSSGKAMDTVIQALSGILMTSGLPHEPPMRIGLPLADLITPLFGVIGILAALQQRNTTGLGQQVDVSMLGVMTSLVAQEPFDLLARLGIPARTGQTAPRLAPFGIYQARDGYVAICAPTEAFAQNLFQAMQRGELLSDARFCTRDARVKNVQEVDKIVSEWIQSLPVAEAVAKIESAGVPVAEVRSTEDAVRDPRVLQRGEIVPLTHPKFGAVEEIYGSGLPIKFSAAEAGFSAPPPNLGEHNDFVYGELLGYATSQIEEWRTNGII